MNWSRNMRISVDIDVYIDDFVTCGLSDGHGDDVLVADLVTAADDLKEVIESEQIGCSACVLLSLTCPACLMYNIEGSV